MEESKQNTDQPGQNTKQKSDVNRNLIFGLAVIVISIAVFMGVKNWMANIAVDNPEKAANSSPTAQTANNSDNLTQTSGDPSQEVEVTASYEKEKSQNQTAFQIQFNTHVIDYSDYNFQENIVLRDSQNKEYRATSVTKQGGGHHQSIEIIFPTVASPFKLVVKNLAGAPERAFNW